MKRVGIVIILSALCGTGCQSQPGGVAGAKCAAARAAAGDGGTSQTSDAAPSNDPHCEAYIATQAPLSTAWIDQQVASGTCSNSPPTVTVTNCVPSASILYASCTGIENFADECTLTADMQTCVATHWTKLCQHNSDCPAGAVCLSAGGVGDVPAYVHPPFGTCEKTCSAAGSAECGRCDMICNTDLHVCVYPGAPPT